MCAPSLPRLTPRRAARLFCDVRSDDTGAATAEYAIATMAAVAFAGLLVVIKRAMWTNDVRPSKGGPICSRP